MNEEICVETDCFDNESKHLCVICRRLEIDPSLEKPKKENLEKLFQCCSKHWRSNTLVECFNWDFSETEISCEVCKDCLVSLNKLYEMDKILEEVQAGIKEFIGEFSKQLLHYQRSQLTCQQFGTQSTDNSIQDDDEDFIIKSNTNVDKIEVDLDFSSLLKTEEEDTIVIKQEHVHQSHLNQIETQNHNSCFTNDDDGTLVEEQKPIIDNFTTQYGLKDLRICLRRLDFDNIRGAASSSPVQTFQCNICPSVFSKKHLLNRHNSSHKRAAVDDSNETLTDSTNTVLRGKRKAAQAAQVFLKKILRLEKKNPTDETEESGFNSKDRKSDLDTTDLDWGSSSEEDCENSEATVEQFACEFCGKFYLDDDSLNTHLQTFHAKYKNKPKETRNRKYKDNLKNLKPFRCSICKATFTVNTSLKKHLWSVHKTIPKKKSYGCSICRKKFPTEILLNEDLLKHKKSQLEKKKYQYEVAKRFKCTACNFSCNFCKEIASHSVETGHANTKKFKCDSCPHSFYSNLNLKYHKLKIHNDNVFRCLICSKKFPRKSLLNIHSRSHRSNKKSYQCEICPQKFSRKILLSQHSTSHSNKSSVYNCTICNESFQWRILRDEHLQVHNAGNFKCVTCGKHFSKKYCLHLHRLIHQKNQISKRATRHYLLLKNKLKCWVCRKKYKTKNLLRQHFFEMHKRKWVEILAKRRNDPTDESYHCKLTSLNVFECNFCDNIFQKMYSLSMKSSWKHHRDKEHNNDDFYECDTCGKLFSTNKELSDHQNKYKYEKESYKCDLCKENFHSQFYLDHHNESSSNCNKTKANYLNQDSFECGVCDEIFDLHFKLSRHFQSHKGARVKCKICNKLFGRRKFRGHYVGHFAEKDKLKCEICHVNFCNKNYLLRHKSNAHSEETPYKCTQCDFRCKTDKYLQRHMANKHLPQSEKKLICEVCGECFGHKSLLTNHRSKNHSKQNYYCKLCDKKFLTGHSLNVHNKNFHTNNIHKLKCSECKKMFTHQNFLTIHMRIHTGERPFECKVCSKSYTSKHKLNTHSDIHSGVKHPCKLCGKDFNSKKSLYSHKITTHGEKKFQCEVCEKKFNRKDNMVSHMRSHNGEKPYQCQQCGKAFTRLDNLNTHLRYHEKIKLKSSKNEEEVDESSDEDC